MLKSNEQQSSEIIVVFELGYVIAIYVIAIFDKSAITLPSIALCNSGSIIAKREV